MLQRATAIGAADAESDLGDQGHEQDARRIDLAARSLRAGDTCWNR